MRIALVGNPNTGKSSLFNALTGLRQKTGNFAGVTVDKTTGTCRLPDGSSAEVTDLPGTYSLFPKSPDEAVPYELLLDRSHKQYPDLVIYVADASNLRRNLLLLSQIIDLKLPVIVALTMADVAAAKGTELNLDDLRARFGVPFIPVNPRRNKGIGELLACIPEGAGLSECSFVNPQGLLTLPMDELTVSLNSATPYESLLKLHRAAGGYGGSQDVLKDVRNRFGFDSGTRQREDIIHRHREITRLTAGCIREGEGSAFSRRQARIDAVLTHKVGGYLIFFLILFVIFQAIFNLASYPMEWIDQGFGWLGSLVTNNMQPGVLADLLAGGILPGLSGVVIFVPQIAFLFMFIAIMEDTGYLARVAFLMDRTMRRFGLNGKSVIPLISGTACAVPAIMSARNIENPRSRLITILVTPLMSCSARLPVYILLIGMAMPDGRWLGVFNWQGMALMGMYLLGFLAAIGGAWLFQVVLRTKEKQYFILELPGYKTPNYRNIGQTVWKRVHTFVTEAGKIILAISIILWFLSSYGPSETMSGIQSKYDAQIKADPAREVELTSMMNAEKLEHSYAGQLGHLIEPGIRPLGFDWKIGISLVTSFVAREVFVGTMTTLYGVQTQDAAGNDKDEEETSRNLRETMRKATDIRTGQPVYGIATIFSLMIFYAFAMQCMSTMAVTRKETGSWKWTFVQFAFMTGLAYLGSWLVYNLLS